jgi:hypothetical protein
MSRKLSLLFLCSLLLISGATSLLAEAAASNDAKASVAAERCGKCGDGSCVKSCGETALSCPIDCGGVPKPSLAPVEAAEAPACGRCGDGWCVAMGGETAANCPSDCSWTQPDEKAQDAECAANDARAEAKKE